MTDTDASNTQLVSNASGPQSASNDSGSVTQHNLKDQIEVDRYLNAKAAVRVPGTARGFGNLMSRIAPGGSV